MNIYRALFCFIGILSAALLVAAAVVVPTHDPLLAVACIVVTFSTLVACGIFFTLLND